MPNDEGRLFFEEMLPDPKGRLYALEEEGKYLLAGSRVLRVCPSCGAKRAAIFSELLHNQILADVPHAQWVFSIPKMLRPYFLHHRELLGDMARLAYETVREMMAAVVDEATGRPGMVAVIQTFSSSLEWNPHIHAIVTRGVFLEDGSWHPIPYVDTQKAELVFRHKVLNLLRESELITQERIDLLLSWRHSGFSVHNHTTVYPSDTEGLHKLACYLMRAPVNLSRLRYHPDSQLILYQPKPGHELDGDALTDPLDFLARVLAFITQPSVIRKIIRASRSQNSSFPTSRASTTRLDLARTVFRAVLTVPISVTLS